MRALPFLVAASLVACAGESPRPEIVTVFACSDYCPGPPENYMRQVYEGVTDETKCRELGGSLFSVVGWGTKTYCGVIDEEQ